jgi:putative addiction module killer protein
VGDGVFELKIDNGPGYRVYFGIDGSEIILLGGGEKDSQAGDIRKAKEAWEDYNAEEDN